MLAAPDVSGEQTTGLSPLLKAYVKLCGNGQMSDLSKAGCCVPALCNLVQAVHRTRKASEGKEETKRCRYKREVITDEARKGK